MMTASKEAADQEESNRIGVSDLTPIVDHHAEIYSAEGAK
jgi:hypothetical protein